MPDQHDDRKISKLIFNLLSSQFMQQTRAQVVCKKDIGWQHEWQPIMLIDWSKKDILFSNKTKRGLELINTYLGLASWEYILSYCSRTLRASTIFDRSSEAGRLSTTALLKARRAMTAKKKANKAFLGRTISEIYLLISCRWFFMRVSLLNFQ